MTDSVDAFHAVIYDHPRDPLPRLVYADWLDDQGEAEYAELIRLWHEIDRRANPFLKPLRDRRHQLKRALHDRWRIDALGFLGGDLFSDGVLPDEVWVSAFFLVHSWREWPPYLRPRRLFITEYRRHEAAVLATPPVRRARKLEFAGVGELLPEPPYPADSDPLLAALVQADGLDRLRTLFLDAVRPSLSGLRAFADSTLAGRLAGFGMRYALSYEEWNDHQVKAEQPPTGTVREAIHEFLSEFAGRLPA